MAELLDRSIAQEYASWFRALSDPTRVQIVEYLARHNRPMPVAEIVAAVGLAQSTVSQHLKILTEVRFVLVEPVGTGAGRPMTTSAADGKQSMQRLLIR